MTEPSSSEPETLREGGDFTLYRGRQHGYPFPVLVMALAADQSPQSLKRLEREYALAAHLDPAWAARPVQLSHREGRAVLILTDPGGEPLDRVLERARDQALDLARVLRIAIGLAAALGRVHSQGLIHKDIKPANVLVDAAGQVWLTGFGIASRLPRESQVPAPPEIIAGTLAYMAPEQTGRMNRSIDTRSDLYSLGVTLYEMLTGALPFSADDPLEWVHCHIARQPTPPRDRAGVPQALSLLVLKLLAKTAEDRYQTAAGVEADLRRCLAQWESQGRIEAFALGAQDVPDRLLIPEQLYGREREIETLLAAFDRVVASGTPELLLVSGYSGVGKSSVVNELQKLLVGPRGLFASGKFDQYKRDIPYATLAQAFQGLVRPLLGRSESELARWRDALREALGANGQLMVNLVPELELVIGAQPPLADLRPQDAQSRFQLVFRRFLGVFARKEQPLALFLDDLQWLDSATLGLLEHLLSHPEVRHLLLIGAYRDNEVGPAHLLVRSFEAIREAGARVEQIILAPLGPGAIGRLIAAALHCEPQRAQPLAQLVQEKTGGNPFFAIQFFTALAEEGLLAFDPVAAAWRWDIERIRAKSYADNVVDLVAAKLQRLPATTQEALKLLACLGHAADIATLTLVHGETEETLHAALREAGHAGLVLYQDGAYQFLHDRIQQAAYSLIAEEQRGELHLALGRRLLASLTAAELAEHLFDVANQLDRGASALVERAEKAQVATIALRAGRKAKAAAAFASARAHFAAGVALLDERDWGSRYELTFSLWLERAECEFLSGNFDQAEQLIAQLLARAVSNVDQAAVYGLMIQVHVRKSEHLQAIASGLTCLRLFDIELPAHPSREQVQEEYEAVWRNLDGRSIESLTGLPLMSDPQLQGAMRLLSALIPSADFTDPHLHCLLVCRMVNVNLRHGTSAAGAEAYARLGTILGTVFHRYGEAYRFARLACELVEKHGLIAYPVHLSMGRVAFWTQPVGMAIDFMRTAIRAASEAGDLTYACYAIFQSLTGRLLRGDPLDAVWRESEQGLAFAREARYGYVVDLTVSLQRFIATMRGRTAAFSSFSDAQFDEAAFEAQLTDRSPRTICWYWILKLKARFLSGDHAEALAAAGKAKALLWASPAHIQLLDYFHYTALAVAALYENASVDEQAGWRELLKEHREQLREWGENYPPTFGGKHALVAAEIARLEGRDGGAMRLYEQAIQSAREHGFVQDEGLAHELAARFYAARGVETLARVCLRNARGCNLRWGALGKVRQLDEQYPHWHEEHPPAATNSAIGTAVAQLDVETVVKASQALSSEIVLGRLIEKLMRIAVEHAGAGRGLLILLAGGEPRIEAEAVTGRGRVEVTVRQAAITPSDLPLSALHYVIRTRERVVLDDASLANLYSEDAYVRAQRARSVLCLPIVQQTKLVGALYLENNLTPRAFTADRVAVLEMLASQAAISLENALLYTQLREQARLLALTHDTVFVRDMRDVITFWNRGAEELYGWSREEVAGQTTHRLLQTRFPEPLAQVNAQLLRTGRWEGELVHTKRNGAQVVVASRWALQRDEHGKPVAILETNNDVTARKQAEETLREREARIRRLVESNIIGVVFWDIGGGITEANDAFLRTVGYSRDDLSSGNISWVSMSPSEYGVADAHAFEEVTQSGTFQPYEKEYIRKDGERVAVLIAGALFEGSSDQGVAFILDLSERKAAEAERARLGERLREAEKMEAVGRFAGGIAHDFNGVLSGILAYAETLVDETAAASPLRRYAQNVLTAGYRGRALVEKILVYSRSQRGKRTPVDIAAAVAETLEMVRGGLPTNVRIEARLPEAPLVMMGDATQLHQVVMNLCANAILAMSEGGTLQVTLEAEDIAAERAFLHGTLKPGRHVRLSVEDHGCGMAEATLARIFEPFFTTRVIGRGTGLGLSIVHAIVADAGGAIDVESVVDQGSTFTIHLPFAEIAAGEGVHE